MEEICFLSWLLIVLWERLQTVEPLSALVRQTVGGDGKESLGGWRESVGGRGEARGAEILLCLDGMHPIRLIL